jgi:hypothetical protein
MLEECRMQNAEMAGAGAVWQKVQSGKQKAETADCRRHSDPFQPRSVSIRTGLASAPRERESAPLAGTAALGRPRHTEFLLSTRRLGVETRIAGSQRDWP